MAREARGDGRADEWGTHTHRERERERERERGTWGVSRTSDSFLVRGVRGGEVAQRSRRLLRRLDRCTRAQQCDKRRDAARLADDVLVGRVARRQIPQRARRMLRRCSAFAAVEQRDERRDAARLADRVLLSRRVTRQIGKRARRLLCPKGTGLFTGCAREGCRGRFSRGEHKYARRGEHTYERRHPPEPPYEVLVLGAIGREVAQRARREPRRLRLPRHRHLQQLHKARDATRLPHCVLVRGRVGRQGPKGARGMAGELRAEGAAELARTRDGGAGWCGGAGGEGKGGAG